LVGVSSEKPGFSPLYERLSLHESVARRCVLAFKRVDNLIPKIEFFLKDDVTDDG
jgi:hypothetical protein